MFDILPTTARARIHPAAAKPVVIPKSTLTFTFKLNALVAPPELSTSDWLDALVFIQFSRISPAGAQTMQAENEEAGDDEQETDASKP